eukprot:TRINITY_DN2172_c0_g1_i2.p1 TRINITY_DN2172_c0_g1~~TRINITY_DN2172_c0_g1_i2.p1  ORF type:complete len:192 (-),score=22.68 TRINITY_DN2172_c0_g1_i2:313-888(-)
MTSYRIVVVGDGAVGKSATTIQLCSNKFIDVYDPTIEDTYRHTLVVDDIPAMIDIQDTAGQEGFQTLFDRWLRWGNGFLVIYSITSRESFNRVNWFMERITEVIDHNVFPVVIVGNKKDLEEQRVVSDMEGRQLGAQYNCKWLEASAKQRINVEEAFADVVRQIRDPARSIESKDMPFVPPEKKKPKCTLL